jgi:hypothetical protein
VICAFLLLVLPVCFYLLFQKLFCFPRGVTDVIAMVRRVDDREFDDLLNKPKEDILRANSSAIGFKQEQRARAWLFFEYLRRMGFNALIILSWAHAEQEKIERPGMSKDEKRAGMISEIVDAGTACRLYMLLALSKLSWRILLDELGIAPVRAITDLRLAAEIDGLETYRRLANAAAALSATHGADAHRQLVALLRGSDFV